MCGRFTQKYTWRELVELYRLFQPARNLEPRYNLAPTSTIDAVRVRDGARELVPMRWGLVPSWWKKPLKDVPATFNARGETVAEKPMFRSAFKRTRCIGYYEWRTINPRSSPTTSVLLTPVRFRSLAFGMNGTTSRAVSLCSPAQ
jgi:putative SOS response-associated peptidase YedK